MMMMGGINLNETGKNKNTHNIFIKLSESNNRIENILDQIKRINFQDECPNFFIEIGIRGIETFNFFE
jgi:hypothetical protein